MTKKILIINGPNLNLLGDREKSKYGNNTLETVEKKCEAHSKSIHVEIKFEQSNVEGEIVTIIQKAKGTFDGIIINAAGYTHTSVAILDALLAVKLPVIEVHITNIYNREEFRSKSLISKAAKGIICGFGVNGYIMALDSMKKLLRQQNENK
jgi:3-dehydroquinate dehydratase-2